MRSAAALLVAIVLAGIAGLAIAAAVDERTVAFTPGVPRTSPIKLKAGETACQATIPVPEDAAFDGVAFAVGTGFRPGPPLAVTVRAGDAEGNVLARGRLAGGYRDVAQTPEHTVWFARVGAPNRIAVCVENQGTRAAHLYGAADAATRTSTGAIDGEPAGVDFAFDFERRSPRSVAELVPAMLDRAALFRADGVGVWTYVLLAALVLLALPALLVAALRAAQRTQG